MSRRSGCSPRGSTWRTELRKREPPALHARDVHAALASSTSSGSRCSTSCATPIFSTCSSSAGSPSRPTKRSRSDPVVLGGGSISSAMEPVAPFFDAILVGDAEDVLDEIVDRVIEWKRSGASAARAPRVARQSSGDVRALALHDPLPRRRDDRRDRERPVGAQRTWRRPPSPISTTPRIPTRPVMPNVSTVHDRINMEIMRGCPNQCRFCQAVKHYRPLKRRSIEQDHRALRGDVPQHGLRGDLAHEPLDRRLPGDRRTDPRDHEAVRRPAGERVPSVASRQGRAREHPRAREHGPQVGAHHGPRGGDRPPAVDHPQADPQRGPA